MLLEQEPETQAWVVEAKARAANTFTENIFIITINYLLLFKGFIYQLFLQKQLRPVRISMLLN